MTAFETYFTSLREKNIAVLGLGVSNRPLVRLLLEFGCRVTGCDRTPREKLDPEVLELEQAGCTLRVGDGYLSGVEADVVFRTPGMHPNNPAIEALRQRGAQVLLVQDYRTESFLTRSLEEQGIPMVTLWPGSGESKLGLAAKKAARGVGLYRRFNKVIREFQPDVIHFHAFPDHMDRLDFPRSRMFYSFHAALERNLSMLGQKNTALLQSLSDDGLTFCGLTSDYAREIGARFHTDRVLCIPNGLDFDRIRSQRYSREELRSLFGIPEDAFLLGTVGRLHPVKNQERMLSILREVQKSRPDARLLIVGADQAGRADLLRRQAALVMAGR